MKTSELRIGNYLNGRKGPVTVTEIRENNRVKIKENPSNFTVGDCLHPIPLTEEWLLRFGFIAKNWYSNFEHWSDTWFQLSSSVIKANKERSCFYFDNEMINIEIKYVHQLQNLYFALTGEELTLEP